MRVLLVALATLALTDMARADGDAARGEARFIECASCHLLDKQAESVGPSLYGVFGRKAGTLADFRYSPALKRAGITWDEHTIDAFITDPQTVIPGNRMPYAGLADPAARADLIAYLAKTFK